MQRRKHFRFSTGQRLGIAALATLASLALVLGCHSGTPAAPAGTTLHEGFRFVPGTRNVQTGEFSAIVHVLALDSASDVPQVGVGILFSVDSGDGEFEDLFPVKTNSAGYAESTLVADGALSDATAINVRIHSGEADDVELALTVFGGGTIPETPPTLVFTITPSMPTTSTSVVVDVSDSTDDDCPGMIPDTWTIDWGDSTANTQGTFSGSTTASHSYSTPGDYNITITIADCRGAEDSSIQTVTIS